LLSLQNTFTTVLSSSEVRSEIQKFIDAKSTFLFFSVKTYSGSISGNEFTLRARSGDYISMFLMAPKIKGNILGENPTTVNLRIVFPYFLIFFYLAFAIAFIALAFVNEMNINGVVRAPELWVRIAFVVSGLALPPIAFYYTTLRPIKLFEARLKEKLLLVRKR
jgi:hypothetical protein